MKKQTLILSSSNTIFLEEDTELTATFVGRNNDEVISQITFLHRKPNINSRIIIKAVLYDESKFDFEGLLKIESGAVNTDTYLKIDCLLMSENAFARAVPSLEIFEDEVKGGHGATIGYLDPVQVNYLMSKGLNTKEAEELIVEAFLGD